MFIVKVIYYGGDTCLYEMPTWKDAVGWLDWFYSISEICFAWVEPA